MELLNTETICKNLVAKFYANCYGQIEVFIVNTTDPTEGGIVIRNSAFHSSKMAQARQWAGL